MSDFLLIHGSCHGAWCWRDVVPALAAHGHGVRAIDLPGHGDDRTPAADITLDACRDAILAAATPETILVGHSWGGIPIGVAAEAAPVKALVFLCAYVPQNGQSMSDVRKAAPSQPILPAVVRGGDGLTYTVDPGKGADLFYGDCPEAARAYALPRLCPQAIAPQVAPAALGPRYDATPKRYIRCANDRTIPPEYQSTMTAGWPAEHVHHMATGHSPFFAAPQALADLLHTLSQEF